MSDSEWLRKDWKIGSKLLVYSRSKARWFCGHIEHIYFDSTTNKEWFTVKYNQNQHKSIQRLSHDIKPITHANTEKMIRADLNIFQKQRFDGCTNNNYQNCPSISRLCKALEYYHELDIVDQYHYVLFEEFTNDIYIKLLDDCIHLHKEHGHQIEDIHNEFVDNPRFTECNIKDCAMTSRHHRVIPDLQENNANVNFYRRIMDNLHFYVFHIFEAGLRTRAISFVDEAPENSVRNDCFDEEFNKIRQCTLRTNRNTELFDRFGRNNNSKFTIKTEFDITHGHKDLMDDDEHMSDDIDTYLDSLYQYLSAKNIDAETLQKLRIFMEIEDYDTVSAAIDISELADSGNISRHVNHTRCTQVMHDFICSSQRMLHVNLM